MFRSASGSSFPSSSSPATATCRWRCGQCSGRSRGGADETVPRHVLLGAIGQAIDRSRGALREQAQNAAFAGEITRRLAARARGDGPRGIRAAQREVAGEVGIHEITVKAHRGGRCGRWRPPSPIGHHGRTLALTSAPPRLGADLPQHRRHGRTQLILLLLAISAGLRIRSERLAIPYASLLVVGGLLLAFSPGLPRVQSAPDVLFLRLRSAAALLGRGLVSAPRFLAGIWPILRLAVLMVLVSTAAVAAIAHAIDPPSPGGRLSPSARSFAARPGRGDFHPSQPQGASSNPVDSRRRGPVSTTRRARRVSRAVVAAVTGTFDPWSAAGHFLAEPRVDFSSASP